MTKTPGLPSLLTIGVFLSAQSVGAQAADAPEEWITRMSAAVQNASYAGTVIRTKGGEVETLKVAHRSDDGVINEKLTIQEGNSLEIIRNGNEVHCILPDSKSVLVETWDDQSTLFTTLPRGDIASSNEYDLLLVREDRIAGRKAVLLAIRPHDQFRFGHHLWLDRATAFPLQTELVDGDGSILEQVKFADINLESSVPAEALSPSVSLENFTYYTGRSKRIEINIDTEWVSDDLPPGFRVVSTKSAQLAGAEAPVTHILYSDGLASVSVFIAEGENKNKARRSSIGGSNAYTLQHADYRITAVGEVPAATVRRIASSMRQK
ncbi:MAG: MucB/RseB C-terminal domain-containing protein [Woeseia sp.]